MAASLTAGDANPLLPNPQTRGFGFPERRPIVETPFAFQPADPQHYSFDPERLRRWMLAVNRHSPGGLEAEAGAIARWRPPDLAGAVMDFQTIQRRLGRLSVTAGPAGGTEVERLALQLLQATPDEVRRRDVTRELKRAILLHTDIAAADVLTRLKSDDSADTPVASVHFGIAMTLVEDLLRQRPADDGSRRWYTAVAAFLHAQHDIASAPLFLRRALERFPDDSDLLSIAGAVHEFLASPVVQDNILPDDPRLAGQAFGNARASWQGAEKFFAQALNKNQGLVEVRLHRGRVLGQLGRWGEALAELDLTLRSFPPKPVQYLAWLFIGENESALSHDARAEAAYRQAGALYPSAPSAQIGASYLARQQDNHRAAARMLTLALSTALGAEREDPWDSYYDTAFAGESGPLLDDLRRILTADGSR